MTRRYQEIRRRYADGVAGIPAERVCGDIQALLGYIDALRATLARQAAREAVAMAVHHFGLNEDARARTH